MLRILRYCVEFVAAFVGVGIVIGVLLAWRLSVSPISSDFLTPYIETGIEQLLPGSKAHLDTTVLTWNSAERAVAVHAENIQVTDAGGDDIAAIPVLDAKISVWGILFGQFLPKDLTIDHPQIKLVHSANGAFVFGGKAMRGGQTMPTTDTLDATLRKLVQQVSHTLLMHNLSVTRAVFEVHDDVTQKDWSVSVPEIAVTRNILSEVDHKLEYGALDGHAVVEVTQKDATASVEVRYAYDPLTQQHSLSSVFSDVTPAFLAGGHPETLGLGAAAMIDLPLTGKVTVTLDKNFMIKTIAAQIHGDAGHVVDADLWDVPCPITAFDFNADYDRADGKLSVNDTRFDFDGAILTLKIDGAAAAQAGQDMDFTAAVMVDNLPMNRYGALLPKPILPDPRYWLTANLRDGLYKHAEAVLKGSVAWHDLGNVAVTEGSGKLVATGGRVTYLDGMPPVEGVNAEAVFDLKKMAVTITSGALGNIHLSPFTVTITGLADTDQVIDIPLQVSGPVPEILALLDHPPLGYAKALGLSPDDITGKIEGAVHFRFPLLKTLLMKDVDLHATANAGAIASSKLIPGVAIDQGAFALGLDMQGFSLKGVATLDKIPFHVAWQENFDPKKGQALRHATVAGTVSGEQWAGLGVTTFNGTKGAMTVTLDMTKPIKDKIVLAGVVDMTPAAVAVEMVDWKKPASVPATLKFTAQISGDKPVVVSSIALRGTQMMADGDAVLSPDMSQLLALHLSPFVLGRSNAAIQFTQTLGDKGALRFDAVGASLDVSGLRGGKDPQKTDPRPKNYHLQVDKLYTGSVGEIDKANGTATRDLQGWSAINLHGLADGDTPLSIELTPQADGHRSFTIACDDFGKAMKGLGFTDTIKGGKLFVGGQSTVENPRVIDGSVKIGDFSVEKLPVLALLINATSPFGFTDIVTDSAAFSRFQGNFHWQGDSVTLTRTHASGSAMGINVDGKIDMNTGDANLQGTLVPFSTVNKILDYIPILGDLLTGGENQGVLAVSYGIKGPLQDPSISVNPISLLTPGFLRNLFFRDDAADAE